MNIIFLSLGGLDNLEQNVMYPDLLKAFRDHGHKVTIVCQREKRYRQPTKLSEEAGMKVLRVKTGNITKTNPIEKGISTLFLGQQFKKAINKYLKGSEFDLILYTTPPITISSTIGFLKKRYQATTYLMLKDIFPQNALDLGLLSNTGWKGLITRYFRREEKQLYQRSDNIGCMSAANAMYLLKHNPYLINHNIEICPNTITPCKDHEIDKISLRKQFKLPEHKTIFICGGNFGKPQDVDFILKVLERNEGQRDRYFVMCGSGTDFYKLAEYSTSHRNQVRVIPYLNQESFGRLLEACDVGLIFLDHRFTIPNYPSRILDYMNHCLPVLAATDKNTDIGNAIVSGNFGWWCESMDPMELCILLHLICLFPETIMEKGINSKRYLENHFSTSIAYTKIMNAYASKHRE